MGGRFWMLAGAIALQLAGCLSNGPAPSALSATQPNHPPITGWGLLPTAVAPAPRTPVLPPTQGAPAPTTGARLTVDAGSVLHPASPYVNGFNRNHSARQFGLCHVNVAAMSTAMHALEPRWGAAYLNALAARGYPVDMNNRMLYRTGHGVTDGRSDYNYMTGYLFQNYWNLDGQPGSWDGYPYDDLRYAIAEGRAMGASLLATVNFGTDTATDAGALARYYNAPSDPLRQAHPLSQSPFGLADGACNVFRFEIGNEIQLANERGHDRAATIETYVADAAPYVSAIRAAQTFPVQIALDGPVNIYWGAPSGWAERQDMIPALWNAAKANGITFDALQYHGYPSYPVREPLAGNAYAEHFLTQQIIPAMRACGADFDLWNDELNAASNSGTRNPGLYGALFQAGATATAFRLDYSGRQLIPVLSDFAWWHAGLKNGYDSLYFQDDDASHTTPIYQFRRLLAENWGDYIVASSVSGVGAWQDTAKNGEVTSVSNLDVTAAKSADGKTLYVLVINDSPNTAESVMVDLSHFTPTSQIAALKRIESDGSTAPWDAAWNQIKVEENLSADLSQPVSFPAGSISFLVIR
ncbi:MAG TPA: hypothetical protein V6D47_02330 [Oscillatoriaceae cyanobacterium]